MIGVHEVGGGRSEHRALLDIEVGWGPPIGGHVRIRPTLADCCPEGAHDGDEAGHTGIVVNVRRWSGASSHPYLVLFDEPQPVMRLPDHTFPLPLRHYAASELEWAD